MKNRTCIITLGLALALFGSVRANAQQKDTAPSGRFPSSSPMLEQASEALGQQRLIEAGGKYQQTIADPAAPGFVHGLAAFGQVETLLATNDIPGALKAADALAKNEQIPATYRDQARRLMTELERRQQGLPARDSNAYRTKLPTLPGNVGAVFVVSSGAEPGGDGSASKPFANLESARDAIRALKRHAGGQSPKGGVRVIIQGGVYQVDRTLNLTTEDSGTDEAPVVYQAKTGESPVFMGGVGLTRWRPITDARQRESLDPAVRDRVLETDLAALGVKDWGDATALRQRPELFCDGVPQTLARWPNEGFVKTGDALGATPVKDGGQVGAREGVFRYLEDRPSRWTNEPDIRLYGYWYWDWFEEYQTVKAIDTVTKVITLKTPYSGYGYRKGQRYRVENAFVEIDQPGEWYLDRRSGLLYWLPPEHVQPNQAQVSLSVFNGPFVAMENTEHIILLGLTFQESRGDALRIRGGGDCLVADCTVRRGGGDALVIEGGTHHLVFGCIMHTLGCGGMRVQGGDRENLVAGHHEVENCHVFDISRLKRTYAPAVLLEGCGNRVAHNLFEQMPSSAMRIEGNDHLIELNEVRHVVQESDDQGGVDIFGNPLYRGIVIRWNHWSDIGGGTACGAAGIRLDDMISGVAIHGNVFERCGAVMFGGVQIHGGKENIVDGNLFTDCFAGISFSRWDEKRWREAIRRFLPQARSVPYAKRYPDLAHLEENWNINQISRNVFAHCQSVFLRDGGVEQTALNLVLKPAVDPAILANPMTLNEDSELRQLLLEPIPVSEMGLYEHPWRAPSVESGGQAK